MNIEYDRTKKKMNKKKQAREDSGPSTSIFKLIVCATSLYERASFWGIYMHFYMK